MLQKVVGGFLDRNDRNEVALEVKIGDVLQMETEKQEWVRGDKIEERVEQEGEGIEGIITKSLQIKEGRKVGIKRKVEEGRDELVKKAKKTK